MQKQKQGSIVYIAVGTLLGTMSIWTSTQASAKKAGIKHPEVASGVFRAQFATLISLVNELKRAPDKVVELGTVQNLSCLYGKVLAGIQDLEVSERLMGRMHNCNGQEEKKSMSERGVVSSYRAGLNEVDKIVITLKNEHGVSLDTILGAVRKAYRECL